MIDFTWYGKKIMEKQDSQFTSVNSQSSLSKNSNRYHQRRMSLNQTPCFNDIKQDQDGSSNEQLQEEDFRTPQSARNSTKKDYNSNHSQHKEQLKDIMKDYPQFTSQVAADYFLNLNNSRLQPYHHKQIKKSSQKLENTERSSSVKSQVSSKDQNQDNGILNNLERDQNLQNEIYKMRYQRISFPTNYMQQNKDQSSLRNLLNNLPQNATPRDNIQLLKKNGISEGQDQNTMQTLEMPKLTTEHTQIIERAQITPRRTYKQDQFNSESSKNIYKNQVSSQNQKPILNQQMQRRPSVDRDSDIQSYQKYNRKPINSQDSKQSEQKNVFNTQKNNYLIQENNQQLRINQNDSDSISYSVSSENDKSLNILQQKISKRQTLTKQTKTKEEIMSDIYKDIKENSYRRRDSYSQIGESKDKIMKDQSININQQQQKELNRFIYKIQKQIGDYRYSEAIQNFYEFEKKYFANQQLNQSQQLGNSNNTMKKSIQFEDDKQFVRQSKQLKNDNQSDETLDSSFSQQNSEVIDKQFKKSEKRSSLKKRPSPMLEEERDNSQNERDLQIKADQLTSRRQLNTQNDLQLNNIFQKNNINEDQIRANSLGFSKSQQKDLQQMQNNQNQNNRKVNINRNSQNQNQLSPQKLKLLSVPRYLSERAQQKKLNYQFCGRKKCFSPDQNDQNIYNQYQTLLKANKS